MKTTRTIRRNTINTTAGDTVMPTDAIADTIAETITEENKAKAPAKKKATKKTPAPKAAPKAEEPKEEPKKVEPSKPEPITFHGFEVAEGVNPSDIEAEEKEAKEAFLGLKEQDAQALPRYLVVGRFMTKVAAMFKSTKLFGEYRKANMPESEALDAGLRSHCGWLFRELTNPESDLFPMLGLEDSQANDPATIYAERVRALLNYRTQNPQVINRHYREAQKKAEAKKKAEERGIEVEDDEEAVKAVRDMEKAEAEKAQAALVKKALRNCKRLLSEHEDKEDIISEALEMIRTALECSNKDAAGQLSRL